jgi:hypothetical protein
MSNFVSTLNPTSFGFFDSDATFQLDADSMVTFVKRKLGDDVLSVELTKRQIWTCFEEAVLEYGNIINQYQLKSELANMLGITTVYSSSIVSGVLSSSVNVTNSYPRRTFEFLMRQAEPYSSYAGLGGSYESYFTYVNVVQGQQDYNLYTDLIRGIGSGSGQPFFETVPPSAQTKLKIWEVMHFNPAAAQHFLLNASNVTNFLANNFNYESYVNSTVFYVLPVFEDILRRGMLDVASRVRRSHYSYQITGPNVRIFPIPTSGPYLVDRIWFRVGVAQNPLAPDYNDSTLTGVSNPSQVPFNNVSYSLINATGRQWIRQYTIATSKEILGLVRRKLKRIPIPNSDLELDGSELVQEGREEKEKLRTEIRELLDSMTYDKLIEIEATKAENINKQLKYIPMPLGKCIVMG